VSSSISSVVRVQQYQRCHHSLSSTPQCSTAR
jgi:hypothetical protein